METFKIRKTLTETGAPAQTLAISPDGGMLVMGSTDGKLRLWSVRDLTGAK